MTHWGAWLGLALALLFLANAPALAAEPAIEGDPIIFEAFVNGVRKGDCLAVHVEGRTESIWVEAASIEKWGVAMGAWQIGERDGTRFARLVASDRMRLAVDMDVLRLSVEFSPEAFGTQRLDLSQAANDPLSPLAGRNGYLDYSLGARWASGAGSSFSAALAATTALGPWILRSEHNLASGAGQFEHVRVRSFAQFDWPGAMSRLSIGDVDAGGGALSQIGPLGGIRFSREFETRPGFVPTPAFQFSGALSEPGRVEVYVDGVRVRTADLQPGLYELQNLRYFAGSRQIDLVVIDAFGNRHMTSIPFYFASGNLSRGLQDFSYTLGKRRFGLGAQEAYRDLSFSGLHRYGLSDALTLGANVDWFPDYRQVGIDTSLRIGHWGTLDASAARSRNDAGIGGAAVHASYAYSGDSLSINASFFRQDEHFGRQAQDGGELTPFRVRSQQTIGFARALGARQSLGLNHSRSESFAASGSKATSLRYSLRFSRASLSANLGFRREGEAQGLDAAISLSIDLGHDIGATAQLESRLGGAWRERLMVDRSTALDSGWSGRLGFERGAGDTRVEGFWRQPAAAGEWTASARADSRTGESVSTGGELRFSGAIATIDGGIFATRPIYGSFALVDAGGLPGVRVYENNQLVGRTGADGRLLVPRIASYTRSQLRLDDRDIPLEIALEQVGMSVVPRSYAGAIARFRAKRIAAAAGNLVVIVAGQPTPVRAAVVSTTVAGRPIESTTGPDGDFYLEDLVPGNYEVRAQNTQVDCTARFAIIEPMQAFTELGSLACLPAGEH